MPCKYFLYGPVIHKAIVRSVFYYSIRPWTYVTQCYQVSQVEDITQIFLKMFFQVNIAFAGSFVRLVLGFC